MNTAQTLFEDADIISTYTRADAIEDGELVDVTEAARETGFRYPIAITRAAWEDCCSWTDADAERKPRTHQDERGRLHDVLWMAFLAAKYSKYARVAYENAAIRHFDLYRVPVHGKGERPRRTTLKMVCGPGDNAEPVITIMLPDED